MVKSRVFGDRSATNSDSKEMQTSGKSDNSYDYDGPSTSKVEVTPKINKEHSSVGKVVWDEIEEIRYQLYVRHSGMGCTADDNVKAWRAIVPWNITQQYTITEMQNEVSNHKITHLTVKGKLPPNIHLLAPELTHLGVGDGEGDFINSISELNKLEELNLSDNDFSSPEALNGLSSLKSLRKLDLESCKLESLPDSISKLSKLEELNLEYNDFSSPEALNGLSSLKSLRKLNLRLCGLMSLPDSISKLSKLEELELYSNAFSSPEALNGLSSLKSLRKLSLGSCRLKSLPDCYES